MKIEKSSADTVVTNKKTGYSLKGAEYGVYTKADCKSGRIAVLKTASDGVSQKIELKSGTYYVKEIKAPPGYALDSKIHTVKISSEETTVLKLKDKPQMNPVEILLEKIDADTKKNEPQGNATLQGAQFTVKFYGGLWEEKYRPRKIRGETIAYMGVPNRSGWHLQIF